MAFPPFSPKHLDLLSVKEGQDLAEELTQRVFSRNLRITKQNILRTGWSWGEELPVLLKNES